MKNMPDKKQAKKLSDHIKNLVSKQNKEMRSFLKKDFNQKQLQNLKTMLMSTHYKKILKKSQEAAADQSGLQTFIQQNQIKFIPKKKQKLIKKTDPLLSISQNIKDSNEMSVNMIEKNLKGKIDKVQLAMVVDNMKNNMKIVIEQIPYYALKDIPDSDLKKLTKTHNNKEFKKYLAFSNKVQKRYQESMLKYIFENLTPKSLQQKKKVKK